MTSFLRKSLNPDSSSLDWHFTNLGSPARPHCLTSLESINHLHFLGSAQHRPAYISPFLPHSQRSEPGKNRSFWLRYLWWTGRTSLWQSARQGKWKILQTGWNDFACFQSGNACFYNKSKARIARHFSVMIPWGWVGKRDRGLKETWNCFDGYFWAVEGSLSWELWSPFISFQPLLTFWLHPSLVFCLICSRLPHYLIFQMSGLGLFDSAQDNPCVRVMPFYLPTIWACNKC